MAENDLRYWYWLRNIRNIGPARAKALVEDFGTPERVYQAGIESYLQVPGVGKDMATAIDESKGSLQTALTEFEKESEIARKIGAQILTYHDPLYPAMLKEQIAVAPPLLYVRGSLKSISNTTVAVIGTRHPSPDGLRWSHDFARRIASQGWHVISGLASGIDTAGHEGALESGGYTVAVLGCGVDRVYPPENRRLYDTILANGGAIISEYPFGAPPKSDNLKKRNKITVALSSAVLVGECPSGSGTLIAAAEALDQAKPVFAFSFPDNRESARGSQQLIASKDVMALDSATSIDYFFKGVDSFRKTAVAVLFDLDGVLVDATRLTRNALAHAIKRVENREVSDTEVNALVRLSPKTALRQMGSGDLDTLLEVFNEYWTKKYAKEITSQPQVKLVFDKARKAGMKIGVVTSRNRTHAQLAIATLKIVESVDVLITWGDTTQHKPSPEPILLALKRLPSVEVVLYVGDQVEDIQAAKAANVAAVGALWFLDSIDEEALRQAAPDYVVSQPSELSELLMKVRRQHWVSMF
jgi:DNA processing protein